MARDEQKALLFNDKSCAGLMVASVSVQAKYSDYFIKEIFSYRANS